MEEALVNMQNSIISQLDTLFEELYPQCSVLIGSSVVIAGIFALIYISRVIFAPWANGEPIEIIKLTRPFIILIAIYSLPALIPAFDGMLSVTKVATESLADKEKLKAKTLQEVFDKKVQEKYSPNEESASFFDLDEVVDKIKGALISVFTFLVAILRMLAVVILNLLSVFYRIVIAIVSPFVFALAVLPSFKDSIASLVRRYINVFLYVPIANILTFVLYKLSNITLQEAIINIDKGADFSMDSVAGLLTTIGTGIIGIIAFLNVPSISGWVVESSGGGGLTSGMNKVGQKASGAAGKAAGSVLGKLK